jgi:hypothetical protein
MLQGAMLHHLRTSLTIGSFIALALAACGDNAPAQLQDAAPSLDAISIDAQPPDAMPAPLMPDPTCEYLDFASDTITMSCNGEWTTFVKLVSMADRCPSLYSQSERYFASQSEAATALNCSLQCVYNPDIAVQFLYCGRRSEFTRWKDAGPMQIGPAGSCQPITRYETVAGSAWASSIDEYAASHPCP